MRVCAKCGDTRALRSTLVPGVFVCLQGCRHKDELVKEAEDFMPAAKKALGAEDCLACESLEESLERRRTAWKTCWG